MMMDSSVGIGTRCLIWSAVLLCLSGCATPPSGSNADMPDNFSLTLWRRTTDLRNTYFELSPAGDLAFGGGRDAVHRMAKRGGPITEDQRRSLWQIVVDTDLLNAKDHPFAQPEVIEYDLTIKGDGWSRSIHLIDNDPGTAGAERLHEAIFKMHAERAYTLPGFQ